jgi:hypothetical protein
MKLVMMKRTVCLLVFEADEAYVFLCFGADAKQFYG